MSETLDQVLYLAGLGLRVHPLASRNKVPIVDNWTEMATVDEDIIRKWSTVNKNCNWGIATGKSSGVFVVDIDPKHNGPAEWKKLVGSNKVPKTLEVVTGTKGTHLYFKYPKGMYVSNSGLTKGVDIRGEDGNIVIPPSTHPNGRKYMWAKGKTPDKTKIAIAPRWLTNKIKESSTVDFPTAIGDKIDKGERNNTIFHQSLFLARQGAFPEFIVTAMKTWVKETKEFDMKDKEIEATVQSAYKHYENEKKARKTFNQIELSDVGNARRLLLDHSENMKYAIGMGYHIWNGKKWLYDEELLTASQLAIYSMDKLRDETVEKMKEKNSKSETSVLGRIHQWSISSHNAAKLKSMIDIAKSYPEILKRPDELDNEETNFLINLNNGTLDLRTRKLVPHNKFQFITRLSEHNYDPKAKCPTWMSTLNFAFDGNKEMIDYFQRAVGYSISGDTSEQCFFICWGPEGNNGKSTILEALQRILGADYAMMSDARVISSKEKDNHVLASLALLNKVRLVSVNEFGENSVLDEELIKQLTGGDTIQAKRLYMAPFTYKPIFKIWVRANSKPIVHGTGNAFWRRVKLIPFEHSIPAKKRKPRHVIDAALEKEADGILAWAVEGFKMWYEKGLQDPQEVKNASNVYKGESDIINLFWEECVEDAKDNTIARGVLYSTFAEWSRGQGVRYVMTSDKFTRKVATRLQQFDRTREGGVAIWKNITLSKYAVQTYSNTF